MIDQKTQAKLRCGAVVATAEAEAIIEMLSALSRHEIPYHRCDDLLELAKDELTEYPIMAEGESEAERTVKCHN